jgi:hypothetical protein
MGEVEGTMKATEALAEREKNPGQERDPLVIQLGDNVRATGRSSVSCKIAKIERIYKSDDCRRELK